MSNEVTMLRLAYPLVAFFVVSGVHAEEKAVDSDESPQVGEAEAEPLPSIRLAALRTNAEQLRRKLCNDPRARIEAADTRRRIQWAREAQTALTEYQDNLRVMVKDAASELDRSQERELDALRRIAIDASKLLDQANAERDKAKTHETNLLARHRLLESQHNLDRQRCLIPPPPPPQGMDVDDEEQPATTPPLDAAERKAGDAAIKRFGL